MTEKQDVDEETGKNKGGPYLAYRIKILGRAGFPCWCVVSGEGACKSEKGVCNFDETAKFGVSGLETPNFNSDCSVCSDCSPFLHYDAPHILSNILKNTTNTKNTKNTTNTTNTTNVVDDGKNTTNTTNTTVVKELAGFVASLSPLLDAGKNRLKCVLCGLGWCFYTFGRSGEHYCRYCAEDVAKDDGSPGLAQLKRSMGGLNDFD